MWRGSPEGTSRAYKYLGSLRLWRYMFTRKRMERILSVVMFNKWQVIQQPNWSKTNTCTYQSGIIVSQLVHSALLPRESFGECLQTTRYNQFSVTRPLLGLVVLVCLREVFTLWRSSTHARKGGPKGWENLVIYPSEKFWKSRDRPSVRPGVSNQSGSLHFLADIAHPGWGQLTAVKKQDIRWPVWHAHITGLGVDPSRLRAFLEIFAVKLLFINWSQAQRRLNAMQWLQVCCLK